MKFLPAILVFLLATAWLSGAHAQVDNPIKLVPRLDSVPSFTISEDSSKHMHMIHVRMSPDSLDAKVDYGSVDSNYLDNNTRKVYLFGKAYVKYKDLSITADYIVVDLDSSIATAEGRVDSLGELAGIPHFKMGEEEFDAKKMRYNFQTRVGKIYEALTKQNDLFIHGEETKFVANADTITHDDILYGRGALITTCDAPHPHFGIRASKVKTIPNKLAVVGSSNLELFGIPTPVWLPFGFYPVSETRRAGILVPRDYERSREWGFGLKELGYYLPLGESADLKIIGDIYFNGSWGLGAVTTYKKKYKYNGSIDLRFSNRISEPRDTYLKFPQKSFSINIHHIQDQKANPYQTIGGTIEIKSNDYQSRNYSDAASVFTNSYHSNFSYSRRFPDKPYTLSASFSHSQNTDRRTIEIHAPELKFNLNRIYPFKQKKRVGPEQWYEKIAFQYNGTASSIINATDTTLFEKSTWDNIQYGAEHHLSSNVNFNVLKYFNFTPSVDYKETWFFKTRERAFQFDPNDPRFVQNDTIYSPDSTDYYVLPDTISYGIVDDTLSQGFTPFRTFSASVSMNTQVFGKMLFKNGWLRGVRHVIKPSIGFSYTPKSPLHYYEPSKFSILYPDSVKQFNRFENLLYGVNPRNIDQANINYSFTNLFEAKYFSKRDSTEKKLKLFDNIGVSGNYNMAADSFQWSPVNISGNTRFFKGATTVSIGAAYSFYALRDNGHLDTLLYSKATGKFLRFDNLRLRFSTRLSYNDIVKIFTKKDRDSDSNNTPSKPSTPGIGSSSRFLDLLSGFSISHEFGVVRLGLKGKDTTLVTTHSINMVGSMRLTPNWSIRFGNIGYDFRSKNLTYPDIGLTRDLHCWQMTFSFQPERGTYQFNIGVKPGTFDFLKYPYRRGPQDVNNGF